MSISCLLGLSASSCRRIWIDRSSSPGGCGSRARCGRHLADGRQPLLHLASARALLLGQVLEAEDPARLAGGGHERRGVSPRSMRLPSGLASGYSVRCPRVEAGSALLDPLARRRPVDQQQEPAGSWSVSRTDRPRASRPPGRTHALRGAVNVRMRRLVRRRQPPVRLSTTCWRVRAGRQSGRGRPRGARRRGQASLRETR